MLGAINTVGPLNSCLLIPKCIHRRDRLIFIHFQNYSNQLTSVDAEATPALSVLYEVAWLHF